MTSPSDHSDTTQVKLAEFVRYPDAQAAVDHLSDSGFAVGNISIVWSRLRKVEYVTGRRTIATAAQGGAVSGLWFGSIIGLLATLFFELEEGTSEFGLVVTYALVGAIVGALWAAFGHWAQRGRRDFGTRDILDAESYEVWVEAAHRGEAVTLLETWRPASTLPPEGAGA